MDQFRDKVAIVTGGASGIGRALCQELGQRGAVVMVADINAEGAQQVASAIATTGGRARAAYLDVSQAEDVQRLVDETASEHGRLDYMFNNAGIAMAGEVRDTSLLQWRRLVDVNLWGVIYGTTAAYSLMVRQGFGHIVNTASLAGLVSFPALTPYAATKHAIVGLSTSLRAEAAGLGVKVSVICPGHVRTGIYDVATVLKASREDAWALIPFNAMEAARAARVMLRGVARNRAIIIFPFHTRLPWWLHRLHPSLSAIWGSRVVRMFRALRRDPKGFQNP
ncbi:MAG: SDR family NAD(P)-dependent oxidoreductase [Anaerolineae bacterium]